MRYIDFNLDPIVYMSFSKECTEGLLGGCNLKTEPLIIRYKKLTRKKSTYFANWSQAHLSATFFFHRNIVVSTIRSFVHVNIQQGTAQILLRKDCEPLRAVACHPRKPVVAMANEMGDLKLWDYNDKVLIYSKVFEAEKNIKCLTFDPQGISSISAFWWALLLHEHTILHRIPWRKVTLCCFSLSRIIPGSRHWHWNRSHTELQNFTKWFIAVSSVHPRQHPSHYFLWRLTVSCHCGKQTEHC